MLDLIRNWDLGTVITDEQLASMKREAETLVKIAESLKDVKPRHRSKVLMAAAVMSYEPPKVEDDEDNEAE